MVLCNLSVITILVLLKYVHCSFPEARVRCEENFKNYKHSSSSNFANLFTRIHQSPTEDTIIFTLNEVTSGIDFEILVYLKLPIFEDRPYIDIVSPEKSGTCLETQKLSINTTFKEKLRQKDLPSSLRLLMCTRTYLECPGEGSDMASFWRRLTKILGEPNIKQCNVESECPENIFDQVVELYQREANEILTSPESRLSDTESTV
ncbi:hypothetical protein B566_EDAN013071 [Ephemera danica]|nr:hypothetical protein B566_EDAN013071 [Ephemera danica]